MAKFLGAAVEAHKIAAVVLVILAIAAFIDWWHATKR